MYGLPGRKDSVALLLLPKWSMRSFLETHVRWSHVLSYWTSDKDTVGVECGEQGWGGALCTSDDFGVLSC